MTELVTTTAKYSIEILAGRRYGNKETGNLWDEFDVSINNIKMLITCRAVWCEDLGKAHIRYTFSNKMISKHPDYKAIRRHIKMLMGEFYHPARTRKLIVIEES